MTHTNTEAVSDERLAEFLLDYAKRAGAIGIPGSIVPILTKAGEALSRRSASNTGGVEDAEKTIAVFGRKLFEAQTQTDPEIAEATNKNRTSLYTNSLAVEAEPVADCANEGHDHPGHDWRTACLKCGVFKGSDLYTHPSSSVSAEVTELTVDEVERIIIDTEPPSQSDHGDKVWTRRMAVALADRLSALNGGR